MSLAMFEKLAALSVGEFGSAYHFISSMLSRFNAAFSQMAIPGLDSSSPLLFILSFIPLLDAFGFSAPLHIQLLPAHPVAASGPVGCNTAFPSLPGIR